MVNTMTLNALNTDLIATSYANLIMAKKRTIESVPESYKVLVYVKLVQAAYMTLEDVPELYRADVEAKLS